MRWSWVRYRARVLWWALTHRFDAFLALRRAYLAHRASKRMARELRIAASSRIAPTARIGPCTYCGATARVESHCCVDFKPGHAPPGGHGVALEDSGWQCEACKAAGRCGVPRPEPEGGAA